ncbi:MAG: hypothetical protein LUQ12_03305 [Methanoregulaceae archaeon]|nr:hypothetical protein [Methanoregulaceae archaeon]
MRFQGLRYGRPLDCHGRSLLPVVALFFEDSSGSAIGSAAVLALFIIEGDQVYFSALSDDITPEDILRDLGKPGREMFPSGKGG